MGNEKAVKCEIRKFWMPDDVRVIKEQMDFLAQITEQQTNGFEWPVKLMEARTADEYCEILKTFLAKENYNLDDLRERGYVPQQYWWILGEGKYIGIAKIRYLLTPFMLTTGGHVGYGLAEAYRGRGYGTAGLGLIIDECRRNGLFDILVTVNPNNFPSRRAVEKNGGQAWGIIERGDGTKAVRYWIDARRKEN